MLGSLLCAGALQANVADPRAMAERAFAGDFPIIVQGLTIGPLSRPAQKTGILMVRINRPYLE